MNAFKRGFMGIFGERIKKGIGDLKEKSLNTINKSSEMIGEKSAEWVIEAADNVVEELRKDSTPLIEQTANSLSPEQRNSWEIIREQIAPSGGFFNTLFARLLWAGSKVSSYVGALVVDSWTGNNDKEKNTGNLEVIFAWMLGGMFKKNQTVGA